MIDKWALFSAIRERLTADATFVTLADGPYQTHIPSVVTWAKPAAEVGEQADTEDAANGYGTRGADLSVRLMLHDRGSAPGVGSPADLYAALRRAETVLLSTPLTASNQTVWNVRRTAAVPLTVVVDDQGYLRLSAGNLYRVRSVEA